MNPADAFELVISIARESLQTEMFTMEATEEGELACDILEDIAANYFGDD